MNKYPVCVSAKRAWTADKSDLIDAYTAQAQKHGLTLWDESTLGELIEEGIIAREDYPDLEWNTPVWKSDFAGGGRWRLEELSVWEAVKYAAMDEGVKVYDSHIEALMDKDSDAFREYILSEEGLLWLLSETYMNPHLYPDQVAEKLHNIISPQED